MSENKCGLCAHKLPVSIISNSKTPITCGWCGGEYVIIRNIPLGWMYQAEKDKLSEIRYVPFLLAALQLLRFRYLPKQFIEKNQPNPQKLDLKYKEKTVALWGGTGTGKTWLFDAFIYKMLQSNSPNLKDRSSKFRFFSLDQNNVEHEISLEGIHLKNEGTPDMLHKTFIFKREDTKEENRLKVNAHCHTIRLFDNPGKNFVGSAAAPADNAAFKALINSDFIIIALNHSDSNTPDELITGLENLRNGIRDKEKKYIAVCLTKADEFRDHFNEDKLLNNKNKHLSKKDRHLDNENYVKKLIEKRFPKDYETILKILENIRQSDGHCLEYFAVSACGFLPNGIPNIDSNNGGLIKDTFEPVNVELPFLWLFQIIEKIRLEPDLNTLYPYLYLALSGKKKQMPGDIIKKLRIKKYHPYSSLLDVFIPEPNQSKKGRI